MDDKFLESEACDSKHTGSSLLVNTVTSQHKTRFVTHTKLIRCGKIIEYYNFARPIYINRQPTKNKKLTLLTDEEIYDILVNPEKYMKPKDRSHEYKLRNINKARNRIRRLVQANFDLQGKFLTFHFKNTSSFDINSLFDCHIRFAQFMRILRSKYHDFRYVAVPEFQKRGAVHYHLMVDIPYTPWKDLMSLWKHGGVFIESINNPAAVGAYISKYVGKALNDERYSGHRCFYSSKNLTQPTVLYGDEYMAKIGLIERMGFTPAFVKTYSSDWCGQITYKSYNLYNSPAQKENDD